MVKTQLFIVFFLSFACKNLERILNYINKFIKAVLFKKSAFKPFPICDTYEW